MLPPDHRSEAMSPDAFAVLLSCAAFVLGLGVGLFLGVSRPTPQPKGKPVSDRRLSRLHVVEREPVERQHLTISHSEGAPREHR